MPVKSRAMQTTPRDENHQIPQIVDQLHDLLQLKKNAVASSKTDFADSMMFESTLKQEEELYAELHFAHGPGKRRAEQSA